MAKPKTVSDKQLRAMGRTARIHGQRIGTPTQVVLGIVAHEMGVYWPLLPKSDFGEFMRRIQQVEPWFPEN